jgi:hypothetical protein
VWVLLLHRAAQAGCAAELVSGCDGVSGSQAGLRETGQETGKRLCKSVTRIQTGSQMFILWFLHIKSQLAYVLARSAAGSL